MGTKLVVLVALAALVPGFVSADVGTDPREEYGVRIARLKYGGGGDWYSDPSSIPNWLKEFEKRTGIKTYPEEKIVSIMDENLRAYPFLYLTGHGTVRLSPDEIEALRQYLEAGGFLYADDNYGMDKSFRELVRRLFPEKDLEQLPNAHPIYHVFYDLPGLPKIHEHDGKSPQGFGITLDDRLVLFYSYESDIGDGLEDPRVHDDPPEKRELAIRMAVNILMYAITQNAIP
ncbi:MAG: DUF4159 domain-containing protein [Candidatus Latescibacterota bacterium]|nr:MAG: DUF4159 domain-containing protein [Candidatus Latescibacterota bacterium]